MRFTVFGAGALGSLLGGLLARAHPVDLVGRDPHMAAVARDGLRIEGTQAFIANVGAYTSASSVPKPDVVVLTVKAYDTREALADLAPLMGPRTILVSAQNGLGNWEAARSAYPKNPVLGASVVYGALFLGPGRVQWNGSGEIAFGGDAKDLAAVEAVVRAFNQAGFNAKPTDNLAGALWLKAIVNAAINPLTALFRVPNGRLLENEDLHRRLRAAAQEGARVAKSEGVQLPSPDPVVVVERIARETAGNRTSMLQSIEKGQRTEIDAITGKILEAARRHRIACPENQALYDAVKAMEASATTGAR